MILAALLAAVPAAAQIRTRVPGAGPARAGSALECLQAAAQSGGCLDEAGGSSAAVAAEPSTRPAPFTVAVLKPETEKGYRRVPTPAGYRDDEDGTLTTGFYKGLDSGFKAVFAAVTIPAVAGMETFGLPYKENAGTVFFMGLGILLSLPAALIGALVGAPVGAAAGMIAEKASPGATKDWFTF